MNLVSAASVLFSGPTWQHLLAALAHSLWQGVVIAVLLRGVLSRVSTRHANARYVLAITALGALVLACLVTWSVLDLETAKVERSSPRYSQGLQGSMAEAPATRPSGNPARVPADTSRSPDEPGLSTSSEISTGLTWVAAGITIWLAGAALMLARTAWLVTGAQRLAGGPLLIDQRVDALLSQLQTKLDIRRAIAIVDAGTLGPAVMGVVRPVLLLPGAVLTGMPVDCLEAMLAHELAHIRRHDYLVNLVQMFIEAVLYFNPAVWWISRQIRREREACCDRLAATATGQPIGYAEALAAWIEQTPAVGESAIALLPAFASDNTLDRIKRLLVADYRPELRASWRMLASSLLTSALVLAIVWRGTQTGVALAAEILSPAQRLSRLGQQQDQLRPVIPSGASEAKLVGTITTSDGKPVPKHLNTTVSTTGERGGYVGSVDMQTPEFSVQVRPGRTWLSVVTEGYAPAVVGPLDVRPNEDVTGLNIVLDPGFIAHLKIVDDQGQPVRGASALGLLSDLGSGGSPAWTGDDSGEITIPHASTHAYNVTIAAPKFQTLVLKAHRFAADETKTVALTPTVPSSGLVVSPAGNPIYGATLRLALRVGPGNAAMKTGNDGEILATTDAEGHFALESLDDAAQYAVTVETSTDGRRLFSGIRPGQTELQFVVGPDITLSGRIIGDLTKLPTNRKKERVLRYSQHPSVKPSPDFSYGLLYSGEVVVEDRGGGATFQICNLLPGDVSLNAGQRFEEFAVSQSRSDIEIDLDIAPVKPEMRRVRLRFVGPDPGIYPTGEIRVFIVDEKKQGESAQKFIAIKDSVADIDAYATGTVSYDLANTVGYWFRGGVVQVTPGEGPLEHEVAVIPAGAVRGQVKNADGTPVTSDVRVGTRGTLRPSPNEWCSFGINDAPVDAAGEFFLTPLPFGTEQDYVLRASRGHETAVSSPIHVDARHVSPWVDIQFSETKRAGGQVVGPDGTPRADVQVTLEFRHPSASTSYSPASKTDLHGRFEFDGLSTGVGEYWATIRREGKPLIEARLNLGGEPVRIALPESQENDE